MEDQNKLSLNEVAVQALKVSANWCMFLSIVGFIFTAFIVLVGIMVAVVMSAIPSDTTAYGPNVPPGFMSGFGNILGGFYIVAGILYFFPIYYMYNYSKGISDAISIGNSEILSKAFVNLKSHHKFLGIMTIVMIALMILGFVGFFIFAAKYGAAAAQHTQY